MPQYSNGMENSCSLPKLFNLNYKAWLVLETFTSCIQFIQFLKLLVRSNADIHLVVVKPYLSRICTGGLLCSMAIPPPQGVRGAPSIACLTCCTYRDLREGSLLLGLGPLCYSINCSSSGLRFNQEVSLSQCYSPINGD